MSEHDLLTGAMGMKIEAIYNSIGKLITEIASTTPSDLNGLSKDKKALILGKLAIYRNRDASPTRDAGKASKKKTAAKGETAATDDKKDKPHKPTKPRHPSIFMGKDKNFIEFYKKHKDELGEKNSRRNTYVSIIFKNLSASAKAFYQEYADNDKKRYEKEKEFTGEWTPEKIKKSQEKDLANSDIQIPKSNKVFDAALAEAIKGLKDAPPPKEEPEKKEKPKEKAKAKKKSKSKSPSKSPALSSSDG